MKTKYNKHGQNVNAPHYREFNPNETREEGEARREKNPVIWSEHIPVTERDDPRFIDARSIVATQWIENHGKKPAAFQKVSKTQYQKPKGIKANQYEAKRSSPYISNQTKAQQIKQMKVNSSAINQVKRKDKAAQRLGKPKIRK